MDRESKRSRLTPGVQIAYVPSHVVSLDHKDVEFGFVTGVKKDYVFCRYWSRVYPGQLRTTANSEATPIDNIIIKDTRPQSLISDKMRELGY